MKIELFKKENNFKKKDFTLNSSLYWKIALLFTLVGIILSFSFGYYLFIKINQEYVSSVIGNSSQVPGINPDRMKKVLDYFSAKAEKSVEIINSPAPVVDPSL